MSRFFVLLFVVTAIIIGSVFLLGLRIPTFTVQTTFLLLLGTSVIVVVLFRERRRTGTLVVPYLASIVLKILIYGTYVFFMIRKQPSEGVPNVIFFGVLYFVFTFLEIRFLYRDLMKK